MSSATELIKKYRSYIVVGLVAALVASAVTATFLLLGDQHAKTAESTESQQIEQSITDALAAFDEGNYDKAKSLLCGSALSGYTALNRRISDAEGPSLRDTKGSQKLTNVSLVSDGSRAFVIADAYREKDPSATAQTAIFRMEKTNGSWKLCNYSNVL